MLEKLFISRDPKINNFTFPCLLSEMIHEAEERYGKRAMDWTVLGVEFGVNGPVNWHPGNRKHIAIRLSEKCIDDYDQAIWELSQEIVHLLAPIVQAKVKVIEEGVATRFAIDSCSRWNVTKQFSLPPKYQDAIDLIDELLGLDKDAIKKLRGFEPSLSEITTQHFSDASIAFDPGKISRLIAPF